MKPKEEISILKQKIQALELSKAQLKLTDEALKKSEEKYKKAFHTHQDSININRLADGMYVSINEGFTELTGYAEAEIIGRTSVEFNIWENLEDRERLVAGLRKDGEVKNLEARFRKKDGSIGYGMMSASVISLDGVPHILSVTKDITERKRMEEALRESEENYRNLIENSNEAIFVAQDGKLVFINPMTTMMIGYSDEDLLSRSFVGFIHPDDRDMVIDRHMRRMKGEELPHVYSFRITRRDGKVIWVELNTVVVNWKGKPATLNFLSEITERKLAEEALQKSEERFKTMFDQAPLGIALNDSRTGRIYAANPMFARIAGRTMEEMNDIDWMSMTHPDDLQMGLDKMALMNAGKISGFQMEKRYLHPDGTPVWVHMTIAPATFEDKTYPRHLCMIEDITERKAAEGRLELALAGLRKAVSATIQVMASAVEARDPYTAGHQTRSADLSRAIATEMGLSQDKIDAIRMAGSIHDIGKLSIPAEILSKPTKLSELEFSLIKEHARQGYEILKDVESPWPLAEMVYQHHERMDGSGYPRHLKGEEILIEARILAVADVVESMASHRPYRPALGMDAALEEIEKNSGILYDPVAVDTCLRLVREKGFHL